MLQAQRTSIEYCIQCLQEGYRKNYGSLKGEYAEIIGEGANLALKAIAKTDAAYHDIEHTILVALTGQEILRGKQLREGVVSCEDWLHCILSLLYHDIGYLKGICHQDQPSQRRYTTGYNRDFIVLPADATDASLTAYHVDRGKRFVAEQFAAHPQLDITLIQHNIELTRFPVPPDEAHEDTIHYPGLMRAADLIGQLADPGYLGKLPALFAEFAENGTNTTLGYQTPEDLKAGFPPFFWNVVYPYIKDSLSYLKMTSSGQQIITNLYGNVFTVERELNLLYEMS
ncbi:metal-dependent phosphohydrolase [Spirulina subsalsa FACHB-351]|uniref:Metal-dependent phosphohydrolase n=1 Tax=Spirulina subsalsa FACHB-351 TaxID=234711 RepID=A0ABT3L5J7_9CYAN|nr:metal-dependent phosphohydrolase [Spirulina subsalsa FACHB-351]